MEIKMIEDTSGLMLYYFKCIYFLGDHKIPHISLRMMPSLAVE